jgi:hypothetical protein
VWGWGLRFDDAPVGVLLVLLVVVVPKRRGKRRVSGCLRMGKQALMMPRLASRRVQTPRSTKWYVGFCRLSGVLCTEVVRRMAAIVTLEGEVSHFLFSFRLHPV